MAYNYYKNSKQIITKVGISGKWMEFWFNQTIEEETPYDYCCKGYMFYDALEKAGISYSHVVSRGAQGLYMVWGDKGPDDFTIETWSNDNKLNQVVANEFRVLRIMCDEIIMLYGASALDEIEKMYTTTDKSFKECYEAYKNKLYNQRITND